MNEQDIQYYINEGRRYGWWDGWFSGCFWGFLLAMLVCFVLAIVTGA